MKYIVLLAVLSGCCEASILYPATLENMLSEKTEPTNVEQDRMISPKNGLWLAYCINGQSCIMENSHLIGSMGRMCQDEYARQLAESAIAYEAGLARPLQGTLVPPYTPAAWRCDGAPWKKF